MSIEETLLELYAKPIARRGGISFNIFGIPTLSSYKRKSVLNSLRRLQQREFVIFEGMHPILSEKGRIYLKNRKARLQIFHSPFSRAAPKTMIVIFDIPEIRKAEREWLRAHLRKFQYEMIQKSVWRGPGPLPQPFTDYLHSIGLQKNIQLFRAVRVRW